VFVVMPHDGFDDDREMIEMMSSKRGCHPGLSRELPG
jgi:hypothetical protein